MIGGASLGYGLKLDLPDVEALDRYTPALNTRVVARDGSSIGSFGDQRRTLLAQKDIPKNFEQALVAVEDSHFYEHGGWTSRGSPARPGTTSPRCPSSKGRARSPSSSRGTSS
jgi:penicillin-binding protein 1A